MLYCSTSILFCNLIETSLFFFALHINCSLCGWLCAIRAYSLQQINNTLRMGARGHGKEGGTCSPPSGNVVKCFCALVYSKTLSIDEFFTHYFHNLSSASRGFAPRPNRGSIPEPHWGTFVPRPLICPPLEKILRAPVTLRHDVPIARRPTYDCIRAPRTVKIIREKSTIQLFFMQKNTRVGYNKSLGALPQCFGHTCCSDRSDDISLSLYISKHVTHRPT